MVDGSNACLDGAYVHIDCTKLHAKRSMFVHIVLDTMVYKMVSNVRLWNIIWDQNIAQCTMKFSHSKVVSTMDSRPTPSVCTYASSNHTLSLAPDSFPFHILEQRSLRTRLAWH